MDDEVWSDKTFKHRRYESSHEVSYCKGSTACSVENATRAILEVPHGLYTQRLEFDLPDGRSRLAETERMLKLAFEKGRNDKAREVRKALNVAEPRS